MGETIQKNKEKINIFFYYNTLRKTFSSYKKTQRVKNYTSTLITNNLTICKKTRHFERKFFPSFQIKIYTIIMLANSG
jgi:hypothetical protein